MRYETWKAPAAGALAAVLLLDQVHFLGTGEGVEPPHDHEPPPLTLVQPPATIVASGVPLAPFYSIGWNPQAG